MASILRLASSATLAADAAAGDLHDLGEVAAHVDEARRVGDVGVAEIEVGFVAVGGKRAGPARKKLCFASMFVRQVRQCFSVVWADGFPRCRHRFPVM